MVSTFGSLAASPMPRAMVSMAGKFTLMIRAGVNPMTTSVLREELAVRGVNASSASGSVCEHREDCHVSPLAGGKAGAYAHGQLQAARP